MKMPNDKKILVMAFVIAGLISWPQATSATTVEPWWCRIGAEVLGTVPGGIDLVRVGV
jgi:hypothetical protein